MKRKWIIFIAALLTGIVFYNQFFSVITLNELIDKQKEEYGIDGNLQRIVIEFENEQIKDIQGEEPVENFKNQLQKTSVEKARNYDVNWDQHYLVKLYFYEDRSLHLYVFPNYLFLREPGLHGEYKTIETNPFYDYLKQQ